MHPALKMSASTLAEVLSVSMSALAAFERNAQHAATA